MNPGFESGGEGWIPERALQQPAQVTTYSTTDYANFIHSGQRSAYHSHARVYLQYVSGVTPGTTYRFGAWGKLWSSTGSDRTISESPLAGMFIQVCIGPQGDGDPYHSAAVCSSQRTPIDTWQYVYVDAVAASDRIAVMLFTNVLSCCTPQHSDAIWDDAALGLAPAAATPTPGPTPEAVRPGPIAFSATGLRDNMVNLRTNLQNLGGLLDRLGHGQGGTCQEFWDYYNALITITTYNGIPSEWQGIHNDYLYAADHAIQANANINGICRDGGGTVPNIDYGLARIGVNESLDRLSPAIDAANALLGQ